MAERTMTDEHKAAIAAGRIEATAVRDYLEAIESSRPKPGRRMSPEKLQERRTELGAELASGTLKAMKRLETLQAMRDIDAQLKALQAEPDMTTVEAGFVEHAASYGARKGIAYATWREFGVAPDVLNTAGISRGQ